VTANNGNVNRIYVNDGDGTFDTSTVDIGVDSYDTMAIASADFNGDGWVDMVAVNATAGNTDKVYLNDNVAYGETGYDNDESDYAVIIVSVTDDGMKSSLVGSSVFLGASTFSGGTSTGGFDTLWTTSGGTDPDYSFEAGLSSTGETETGDSFSSSPSGDSGESGDSGSSDAGEEPEETGDETGSGGSETETEDSSSTEGSDSEGGAEDIKQLLSPGSVLADSGSGATLAASELSILNQGVEPTVVPAPDMDSGNYLVFDPDRIDTMAILNADGGELVKPSFTSGPPARETALLFDTGEMSFLDVLA
jgi:hypothetical protein